MSPKQTQSSSVRVLVVDDHALTRQGIMMTVNSLSGFEVASTLEGGTNVFETVKNEKIDLILLDLDMPDRNGLTVLAELCGGLDADVIVLSGTGQAREFDLALKNGARAIVGKADDPSELIAALKAVKFGQRFISSSVRTLLGNIGAQEVGLSPRQFSILSLLKAGEANKEIAYKLGITPPTVSFHLAELRRKLDVDSNRKILNRAQELGLI